MLFDTHCHLQEEEFDRDREEVIQRALDAGVDEILICGYDIPSSEKAIQLAQKRNGLYASCGIHPHSARELTPESLATLRKLAKSTVAIGEIGLDFYRNLSPRETQVKAFKTQVELARDLGLPIIVHLRKAHSTAIDILKELGGRYKGVMHCFSGGLSDAVEALKLGFYISFSGSITFNSQRLEQVLRVVPEDRLLIETDAPYLAPVPYRGKRNEPAHLRLICDKVAIIRGITYEDMARITRVNGRVLFLGKLPPPALVYKLGTSLYLNVTNRCTNQCSFCIRSKTPLLRGYNLKLDKEPTVEELLRAVGDPTRFKEIVFCGYGEPLIRLELVKLVAARLKERGAKIRINTNGLANLIHGRNIVPEIANLVDSMSISLNAESKEKYTELCNPRFGAKAYDAILDFIKDAKNRIGRVVLTAVALPDVDVNRCREIAEKLGCEFKVRKPFDGTGLR